VTALLARSGRSVRQNSATGPECHDPFIVMVHGICPDTGSKGMLWVAAQRRIGSEERMRWVFGHEGAT
jgi:hypothetical protein